MTFAYLIKQLVQQWINVMANNQLAQTLIVQESPSIPLAKQIERICCLSRQQGQD
ncbi:hypothetical protein tinsulaeT_22980 [Thalassotalea insulae]|uniref:Uncharacterized protein n=1 Tax=Thalassotalea insulae TaxID=2056778 RepID=A0ABQ6GSQ7_9GAMM|nr:hypothetical protein [Thalassotalea insulae]GLX78958.1 hypothetical protein tinsulaeT_22980 [Thalassotalea insulae]